MRDLRIGHMWFFGSCLQHPVETCGFSFPCHLLPPFHILFHSPKHSPHPPICYAPGFHTHSHRPSCVSCQNATKLCSTDPYAHSPILSVSKLTDCRCSAWWHPPLSSLFLLLFLSTSFLNTATFFAKGRQNLQYHKKSLYEGWMVIVTSPWCCWTDLSCDCNALYIVAG